MRSMVMGRGKLGIAALAALSLAASASQASAAVTVGQLAPGTPMDTCAAIDSDELQTIVASGNSYVVPATGTITSWSHNSRAVAGQQLTMKIFRKAGESDVYRAVGHDGPRALAGGMVNTFPTGIAVQLGDILGLNLLSPVSTSCAFGTGNLTDTISRHVPGLPDGASGEFVPAVLAARLNVTAVVEPLNSFTIGKPKLNKKKGTAILRVSVPNPGTLALGGKGVKPASAPEAVIARTVNAPGTVKLVVKAKGKKKKRKLRRKGRAGLKAKITYTPTGGDPAERTRKLKLKKR